MVHAPDITRDPALITEARQLIALLLAMLDATIEERSELLRFTIDVPREWATLAAWLIPKADTEVDGQAKVLPRPIELTTADGQRGQDWDRARACFNVAIGEALDGEWQKLRALVHPVIDHTADDPGPVTPGRADDLRATLRYDIPV